MHKIAIIQFPGLNTEYETRREIARAGMRGEFFRWNEDPAKLAKYDGYVIGGGFSYEDRSRAGVIASLDPVMKAIKEQAAKGKPVLGICNGAQILVESGLIPGADGNRLAVSLARNKRMKEGEVLGTGYYNAWGRIKASAPQKNTLFTWNIPEGEILSAPVAHGEGRFTSEIKNLFVTLYQNGQIPFRYCDAQGVMSEDFPINPNGAMFNAAALTNPQGNVMGIMPHLERSPTASLKLFTSMRDGITAAKKNDLPKKRVHSLKLKTPAVYPLKRLSENPRTAELFISLIITDNEADTVEMTLRALGFNGVEIKRSTHMEFDIQGKEDLPKLIKTLIQSGILLNTNKECATVRFPSGASGLKRLFAAFRKPTRSQRLWYDAKKGVFLPAAEKEKREGFAVTRLLVREKPDFVGLAKLHAIQKRLKIAGIENARTGTLWEVAIPAKNAKMAEQMRRKVIETHIFMNPHRQEAFEMP